MAVRHGAYDPEVATILLHPLPLDGSAWDSVAEQCAGDVEVVPSLYHLGETLREWASAVLDLMATGSHTVIGNSVGASCAAEIAYLAPDRVDRLVLVGGKLGHRPEPNLRDEAVRTLLEEGVEPAWATYWRPLFGPEADCDLIDTAQQRAIALGVDDIVRGVRAFHGRTDRSDLCDRWRGRLDVVSGAQDRSPSVAAASTALHHAAEGQLHVLDGIGHYVPLEAPGPLAGIINRGAVHRL